MGCFVKYDPSRKGKPPQPVCPIDTWHFTDKCNFCPEPWAPAPFKSYEKSIFATSSYTLCLKIAKHHYCKEHPKWSKACYSLIVFRIYAHQQLGAKCLAQGHTEMLVSGAGDRTTDHLIEGQQFSPRPLIHSHRSPLTDRLHWESLSGHWGNASALFCGCSLCRRVSPAPWNTRTHQISYVPAQHANVTHMAVGDGLIKGPFGLCWIYCW